MPLPGSMSPYGDEGDARYPGEGDSAVPACIFECTEIDLLIAQYSPESAAPATRKDITAIVDKSKNSPGASSYSSGRRVIRIAPTSLLNGEQLSLVLLLTPMLDQLEETVGATFAPTGKPDVQLECWNALLSNVYITVELLEKADPLLQDLGVAEDNEAMLVYLGGKEVEKEPGKTFAEDHSTARATPTMGKLCHPKEKAKLVKSKHGGHRCTPAMFEIEFLVKQAVLEGVREKGAKVYLSVKLDLYERPLLRRLVVEAASMGSDTVVERVHEQAKRSLQLGRSLYVASLDPRSEEEDEGILRQLVSMEHNVTRPMSQSDTLFTLLRPVTLLEPLLVEVESEIIRSTTLINVMVTNLLDHDIDIHEIKIHLATTVPAKSAEKDEGVVATPAWNSITSLQATPKVVQTSPPYAYKKDRKKEAQPADAVLPLGFTAEQRVECSLEAVEGQGFPVRLCAAEIHGFLFQMRKYSTEATPSESTTPQPRPKSAPMTPRAGRRRSSGSPHIRTGPLTPRAKISKAPEMASLDLGGSAMGGAALGGSAVLTGVHSPVESHPRGVKRRPSLKQLQQQQQQQAMPVIKADVVELVSKMSILFKATQLGRTDTFFDKTIPVVWKLQLKTPTGSKTDLERSNFLINPRLMTPKMRLHSHQHHQRKVDVGKPSNDQP